LLLELAKQQLLELTPLLPLLLLHLQDKPLRGADPVIWYSFGVTHLPRLEDFPIMPVETVGFMLKPYGFFVWNPTLDIPPERNAASKEEITPAPRNMSALGARSRM
jgi:primary-amine oxidase